MKDILMLIGLFLPILIILLGFGILMYYLHPHD